MVFVAAKICTGFQRQGAKRYKKHINDFSSCIGTFDYHPVVRYLCKAKTALGSCPARWAADREAFQAVPATGAMTLPMGAK